MNVNIKKLQGEWDLGYCLDKHTISSTPLGVNEAGHMQFDTIRPEAGEALFQLKYRSDFSQVAVIANQMNISFSASFNTACLVVPMPSSTHRTRQPVTEIARTLAQLMNIPCYENLLMKTSNTPSMKDIQSREEKVDALAGAFSVSDVLSKGEFDILIIDDLFDTGASLEAATHALRNYDKIRNIYVATVTRKR